MPKKQTTLFLHVGRADPRPLVTVPDENADQAQIFGAHKQVQYHHAITSGVDLARVSFSTETTEIPDAPKARKGGSK